MLKKFSNVTIESFREIKRLLEGINPDAERVFHYWPASILPYIYKNNIYKNSWELKLYR